MTYITYGYCQVLYNGLTPYLKALDFYLSLFTGLYLTANCQPPATNYDVESERS